MNDEIKFVACEEVIDGFAIADIERQMREVGTHAFEPLPVPGRVTFGAEEVGPHVVINTGYGKAHRIKKHDGFRPDETAATSDKNPHKAASARLSGNQSSKTCITDISSSAPAALQSTTCPITIEHRCPARVYFGRVRITGDHFH
jgi:hypothetical protein